MTLRPPPAAEPPIEDVRPYPTADCTCVWSVTPTYATVYLADDACPDRPHRRAYDRSARDGR